MDKAHGGASDRYMANLSVPLKLWYKIFWRRDMVQGFCRASVVRHMAIIM